MPGRSYVGAFVSCECLGDIEIESFTTASLVIIRFSGEIAENDWRRLSMEYTSASRTWSADTLCGGLRGATTGVGRQRFKRHTFHELLDQIVRCPSVNRSYMQAM